MPDATPARPRLPHAHLVQNNPAWESPAESRERARRLLAHAPVAPHAGDLILFTEMFATGFSMNTRRTADDGSTLDFLRALATETGCTVQGGRTVRQDDAAKARNVMTTVAPGGRVLCEYAKIHPFSLGREDEHFESGMVPRGSPAGLDDAHSRLDEVLPFYDWNGLTVCPAICYDLRFPELFRLACIRGAEVFAIGACWPRTRQHHWRTLLLARAIENQAYVFGVNRVGSDPETNGGPGAIYAGGSIVVTPTGETAAELSMDHPSEQVLSAPIDPDAVRNWRAKFPAWRDHRMLAPATVS